LTWNNFKCTVEVTAAEDWAKVLKRRAKERDIWVRNQVVEVIIDKGMHTS